MSRKARASALAHELLCILPHRRRIMSAKLIGLMLIPIMLGCGSASIEDEEVGEDGTADSIRTLEYGARVSARKYSGGTVTYRFAGRQGDRVRVDVATAAPDLAAPKFAGVFLRGQEISTDDNKTLHTGSA